jgi:hypothetical protein
MFKKAFFFVGSIVGMDTNYLGKWLTEPDSSLVVLAKKLF